jgi:hypothetical protein
VNLLSESGVPVNTDGSNEKTDAEGKRAQERTLSGVISDVQEKTDKNTERPHEYEYPAEHTGKDTASEFSEQSGFRPLFHADVTELDWQNPSGLTYTDVVSKPFSKVRK